MVNVAIIDDGVGTEIYDINKIYNSIEIDSNLIVRKLNKFHLFKNMHGTICAAIIKKYYSDILITSIKILNNDSHRCNKDQLIKAIEWCIDNNIQVINMSIGTTNFRDFEDIRKVVNRAYSEGVIIIAACNNRNIITYPASYANVIGVKCSTGEELQEGKYIFNLYPLDGIDITACSEHLISKCNGKKKRTSKCNSFATPMITAQVCSIKDKYPNISLQGIKEKLYRNSINYIDDSLLVNNCRNIDWINNGTIVNINKKSFSLLENINEIVDFKNINKIKSDKFDTLIVLNDIEDKYSDIDMVVKEAIEKEKNIVVLNEQYIMKNDRNIKVRTWYPDMIKHFYEGNILRKKLDIPLIILYGFNDINIAKVLQTLTYKFKEDGYYAIGTFTKSIGVLYGLEYIPIIKGENYTNIRNKIEALYKIYDCDVLILGITISKKDVDDIKKINIYLNPDKTVIIADKVEKEKNIYINQIYKRILLELA